MFIRTLRKSSIFIALTLAVTLTGGLGVVVSALATSNSAFTQTINPGALAVSIVDGGYLDVVGPSMAMTDVNFSYACQTSTGSFGTPTEQIIVSNPDAANGGWNLSLAAATTTGLWASAGTPFDFNDPTGAGCTDGPDADAVGGQMTVDPAIGTLAAGSCATCTAANITKGTSASFSEGVTNSINLLSAAAASDDIGNWTLRGVGISQKIPMEQPVASDYLINMVLTVVAI